MAIYFILEQILAISKTLPLFIIVKYNTREACLIRAQRLFPYDDGCKVTMLCAGTCDRSRRRLNPLCSTKMAICCLTSGCYCRLCAYIYKNIYFKLYRSTSQQHRKEEFKHQLLIALLKIQIVVSFEALINKNKEDHISCQTCLYIGPVKSDRKLDGAETHRGYVLKNATNAHKYTHYSIYTPHRPIHNCLLLVYSLYKMYTSIHLLTAVLKEGWMWRIWGEVWHWEAERRWSRRKRSTTRSSTRRRQCLDWRRGLAETPPGS